jgi:hypothetical protein
MRAVYQDVCRRHSGEEDAIGDGGGLGGRLNVMHPQNVSTAEDGGDTGGDGGAEASIDRRRRSLVDGGEVRSLGNSVGEKPFTRGSNEERPAEAMELSEVNEEWVVLIEALAEAKAGIEDDVICSEAGRNSSAEARLEAPQDERNDVVRSERGKSLPLGGCAARVHEDGPAVE